MFRACRVPPRNASRAFVNILPSKFSRRVAVSLALTMVLALAALSGPAALAADLQPGDVVMIVTDRAGLFPPGAVVQIDGTSGQGTTLASGPPLTNPRDVVVRSDGTVLVADAASGLLAVNPGTGAVTVVVDVAALGGTGPTAVTVARNGDVLLAGSWGVKRLAGGEGPPLVVSATGLLVEPDGIAVDDAGLIWVSDYSGGPPPAQLYTFGGVCSVDPSSGAQTWLGLSCSTNSFPHGPQMIHVGPDGNLYVLSAWGYGPGNYQNCGIYRVSPTTGVAEVWLLKRFVRGFDLSPGGTASLLYGRDISNDPYDGILATYDGTTLHQVGSGGLPIGPIALVHGGPTPTRLSSWGSLKARYH